MATSFIHGDSRSGFYIPGEARSIFSSDIDNDGHPDIICGHRLSAVTHWGGISVMKNKGNGYYEPADSFLVASGVGEVHCDLLDDNNLPDIFYCYTTSQPKASYMGIIFNYQSSHFTDVESISLVPNATVSHLACGDLDGF